MITRPYSKLTDNEKEMCENYINAYAEGRLQADLSTVLSTWNKSKQYLFENVFNGNLIVKAPVEVEMDHHEIELKIWKDLFIYNTYYKILEELYKRDRIINITYGMLVDNIYDGPTTEIDGVKFVKGETKLLRALGKLHLIDDAEFTKFRDKVSIYTNERTLSGDLCLSIHPLDFMTMSDNACDWQSCMSWAKGGCYRAGTVEMMNSPMVVVAYLTSSTDMSMPGGGTWNSKKWRELFIVTGEGIFGVKGYPYHNYELEGVVLNRLNAMLPCSIKEPIRKYVYEEDYDFTFSTYAMYNDFGSLDAHQGIFHTDDDNEYFYSGEYTCMSCGGQTYIDEDDEEAPYLSCKDCRPVMVDCYNCGAYIREEDALYDDFDNPYCPDCFEKKTAIATYSGNRGPKNCIHPLYDMDGNCLGTICRYDMKYVPYMLYDKYHLDGNYFYSSPYYFTNDGKYIVKLGWDEDGGGHCDVIKIL